jgi:hypothetical protein
LFAALFQPQPPLPSSPGGPSGGASMHSVAEHSLKDSFVAVDGARGAF